MGPFAALESIFCDLCLVPVNSNSGIDHSNRQMFLDQLINLIKKQLKAASPGKQHRHHE